MEVAFAHLHVKLSPVAVGHFRNADGAAFLDGGGVVIADIAEHSAEAAILLHVFANVFGGQHQGDRRHRLHLHHVLRIAAQVFVSPARFPDHVHGVGFAWRAGGDLLGEKDTAIDLEGKGVQVEDGDGFVGLRLFEQPLNFGVSFGGPALAGITELAGILAQQRLRIGALHFRGDDDCCHG